MDEINKLASSIDFDGPYDDKGHEDIYDLLGAVPQDEEPRHTPPALVFYAVRNILQPYFILGQIPDLIDLLALAEFHRQSAVLMSEQALELHACEERDKRLGLVAHARLLTASEMRALRRFVNNTHALRREYIVLVRSLIQLYVHYLWNAPELCLLFKRLNDVFPGSIVGINRPSELLFHVDLSEDERAYFGQLQLECQAWVKIVDEWTFTRGETGREEGRSQEDLDACFTDDFRDAFPPPSSALEMAQNVQIYLKKVENMVQKLEEWFPPTPGGDMPVDMAALSLQ